MSCGGTSTSRMAEQHIPSTSEIYRVEQRARLVVGLMRRFVDSLRSVDAFAPVPSSAVARSTALKGKSTGTAAPAAHVLLSDVRLMPILAAANLVEDIAATCVSKSISDATNETVKETERDRYEVVSRICIPLLKSLAECYAVLDLLPQTEEAQNQPLHQQQAMKAGRKKKQKPKPPRGLLSIADYTDVACLLEFVVCTSILPNIESKILPTAEERVRFLPKSLCGRLHRRSLLWGQAVKGSDSTATKPAEQSTSRVIQEMNELRQSSAAIGFVITLERFRPMLLPRHAADIMAALFQSDRYQELSERHSKPTATLCDDKSHSKMLNVFLGRGARDIQFNVGPHLVKIHSFDPHTCARAYQTLLSGGTKTPQWLRRRVGSLLNSLAASNLLCVVDVFVVAASSLPTGDISAASARLGRVLCTVPFPTAQDVMATATAAAPNRCTSSNSFRYYQRLFRQLALLLDIAAASNVVKNHDKATGSESNANFDPRVIAGILTVWAVIDNTPHHILEALMLPMLVDGLVPLHVPDASSRDGDNVGKRPSGYVSIKRLHSLLSFAPRTAMGLGKLYQLLLLPLRMDTVGASRDDSNHLAGKITVLGQLVRVAATAENVVESSKVVEDALRTLRMIVHGIATGRETLSFAGLEGQNLIKTLSVALLEAVCVNSLDVAGMSYQLALQNDQYNSVQSIELKSSGKAPELDCLVQDIEQRARVVVVDIVAKLFGAAELAKTRTVASAETKDEDTEAGSGLPNTLFCLLLLIYFGDAGSRGRDGSELDTLRLLPESLRYSLDSAKLTSMAMLPLCCEYCSPAVLIIGKVSTSSGNMMSFGVFAMIKLIISCLASRYQDKVRVSEGPAPVKFDAAADDETLSCMDFSNNLSNYDEGLYVIKSNNARKESSSNNNDASNEDEETLLSISSIVVSLLVAMLELGEEKRLPTEEEMLSLLIPALQVLSSLPVLPTGADNALSRLESEIAEMASHAVALIHSRGVGPAPASSQSSRVGTIQEKIRQAEQDLRSEQAPIRARGVVSLRHIARGYIDNELESLSITTGGSKPLIVEIGKDSDKSDDSNLGKSEILEQLVRICAEALQDSESYVYLAAIQTLVAIADANPAKVMPLLGQAVSLGHIDFSKHFSECNGIDLSSLQRIKATEALLFAIKRRGEGVFVFGQSLMNLMLYGCMNHSKPVDVEEMSDIGKASTIQVETEKFFNAANAVKDDDTDLRAEEEERRLRINTGGPVFDAEEDDVVRAGCISVVTELVSTLPPFGIVRYCFTLMELAKQVLRLDPSRPMRRAAALLCRELYTVVVREFDEADSVDDSFFSFASAMVSCGEDALHATLEWCISGDDLDIVGGNEKCIRSNISSVQGKVRMADLATMARCQEALAVRASIDVMRIFAAAKLLLTSKDGQKKDLAAHAIIKRLREMKKGGNSGGGGTMDSIQAMRGL